MASRQTVWDSNMVLEAADKINNGFLLKRAENPFYENTIGLRKKGVAFRMSQMEIDEYIKCKTDIHYFAENYCWIKGEQGEPVRLKLRDYQSDVLDSFFTNRFNILMASRQIGKCFSFNTIVSIESDNQVYNTRFGNLYYYMVSKERSLTILEKIKIKLYDCLFKLENLYQPVGKNFILKKKQLKNV